MGVKTLQSPPGNGIMAIGETQENPELMRICRDFLSRIDYKGIGGLEFKYFNGKYYFIEMSIRIDGFISISDSFLPLSLIAYEDAVGILDVAKYELTIRNVKYMDLRSHYQLAFQSIVMGNYLRIYANCLYVSICSSISFIKYNWKPFVYNIRFIRLNHFNSFNLI